MRGVPCGTDACGVATIDAMRPGRVPASGSAPRRRAPAESARLYGRLRGVLVFYGIAVFTWLFRTIPGSEIAAAHRQAAIALLAVGLGLQFVRFVVRAAVERHERRHGMEGALSPAALFVVDLAADGITVGLFVFATLRGVMQAGALP